MSKILTERDRSQLFEVAIRHSRTGQPQPLGKGHEQFSNIMGSIQAMRYRAGWD